MIAKADSIVQADSLAKQQQEAANQIEKAREDSIANARKESEEKLETWKNKVPTLKDLDTSNPGSLLKKRGFKYKKKVIASFETHGWDDYTDIYTLRLDSDHYCIVKLGVHEYTIEKTLTIVGAPDKLEQAKSQAKEIQREINNGAPADLNIGTNTISIYWH
ncbi:MAG: hypothetical protein K2N05_09620 [Muribaculaceae bacterium]|nr:hypothetical protein [Muribaculaceae bacterium]